MSKERVFDKHCRKIVQTGSQITKVTTLLKTSIPILLGCLSADNPSRLTFQDFLVICGYRTFVFPTFETTSNEDQGY